MDGYYAPGVTLHRLQVVAQAARSGLAVKVVGFSFNARPLHAVVAAFRALPAEVGLCPRDPVSAQRLAKLLDRPVCGTADLAFLLEPAGTAPPVTEAARWSREEQRQGRLVLGLNANPLLCGGPDPVPRADLVRRYAQILAFLRDQGLALSLLLIPHDFRAGVEDQALLEEVRDLLPPEVREHTRMLPPPLTAAEVKGLCRHLDFALSARMHLSIACLGQGVPVLGIEYQDKVEGLFGLFGLQNLMVSPAAFMADPAFPAGFLERIRERSRLREVILGLVPSIRALARGNLQVHPPAFNLGRFLGRSLLRVPRSGNLSESLEEAPR